MEVLIELLRWIFAAEIFVALGMVIGWASEEIKD